MVTRKKSTHRKNGSKRKNHKTKDNSVIELIKGRPRKEEERFFNRFSGTQLNAILLIILSATFLFQGIIQYTNLLGVKTYILRPWFILMLTAIILLATSVGSITIAGVISPLKRKRLMNVISFIFFIIGFVLFVSALIYLLVAV